MKFQQTPWKHDPRSEKFSHTQFFGAAVVLPRTLGRKRMDPYDQGASLRCAPTAAAANGHYIHGLDFSVDWQVDKVSRLQRYPVDDRGSDPNAAMKSQLFPGGGYLLSSDYANVPGALLDPKAENYGNSAYVKPDGGGDVFESIKIALTMAYDPKTGKGACVQAFGRWFAEWTPAFYIPQEFNQMVGYHSYLFIDFDTLNGIDYLVAQNSYGRSVGMGGFHYFPREVVNREFTISGTTLKIPKTLSPEDIAAAKQETPLGYLWRQVISIWQSLMPYLN